MGRGAQTDTSCLQKCKIRQQYRYGSRSADGYFLSAKMQDPAAMRSKCYRQEIPGVHGLRVTVARKLNRTADDWDCLPKMDGMELSLLESSHM